MSLFAIIAAAYLIGSIPTGYWLGKWWKGIDIRQHGSGNPGATNVFRVLGKVPGILTLSIDALKGALPVLGAQRFFPNSTIVPLATGLAAIAGHTASVFLAFRGGKGVATSAGVFAALLPVPFGAALAAFILCLAVSRRVSLSSIVSSMTLAVVSFLTPTPKGSAYATATVACFVIWKHRSNLKRLCAGTEPPIW